MKLARQFALVSLALAPLGCGGEDAGGSDSGVAGTRLVFELGADLDDPERFFDQPYPSDLRVDEGGHPRVAGYPNPKNVGIVDGFKTSAAEARGFPVIPVAYFRFDGPLAPRSLDEVIPAEAASPILIADVDPGSPERGRLVPVIAQTTPSDPYVPEFLLTVAPRPGFVLRPDTTYAVVVMRAANDEAGKALGVPAAFNRLVSRKPSGAAEKQADANFAPLWDTLSTLQIDAKGAAAATVFTTGDVVEELAALTQKLVAKYDVTLDGLAAHDDAEVTELCILAGSVELPQFQTGKPPFSTDGRFVIDA